MSRLRLNWMIFCSVVGLLALMPTAEAQTELEKHLAGASGAAGSYSRSSLDEEYWILRLINDVEVPALEAGQIDTILVREGQVVRESEIIATMENRLAKRGLEEAKARLALTTMKSQDTSGMAEAKAKLDLYQEEFKTVERLYNKGDKSANDYRTARAQFQVSKAGVERAEMEQQFASLEAEIERVRVGAAEDALERRIIRAPFDGLVMSVEREAKEWVNAGDKVVRVIRLDRLRVKGELSIKQYSPSSVTGRQVVVSVNVPGLNTAESFNGVIVFAKPDLTIRQEFFEVWAEIENRMDANNHWLLYPGLRCDMKILGH